MHSTLFRWTTSALLLVAVLLLNSLVQTYNLPRLRQPGGTNHNRGLSITPKDCTSNSPRFKGLIGTCMFNLECQERGGSVIGACVDRFLFGACCHIVKFPPIPSTKETELNSSSEESEDESSDVSLPETSRPKIGAVRPWREPTTTTTTSTTTTQRPSTKDRRTTRRALIPKATTAIPPTRPTTTTRIITTRAPTTTKRVPTTTTTTTPKSTTTTTPTTERTTTRTTTTTERTTERTTTTEKNVRPETTRRTEVTFKQPHFESPKVPSSVESPLVRGESAEDSGGQAVVPLHDPHPIVPARGYTTLPPPRHYPTLLPLTLETFSSVSDPLVERHHGDHHHLRYPNGKPRDPVEPTTLSPLRSDPIDPTNPPKLSTFMYVDGMSFDFETMNGLNEDKTTTMMPGLNENLNSNTENVWSVVLQLAGGKSTTQPPATDDVLANLNSDELFNSLIGNSTGILNPAENNFISSSIINNESYMPGFLGNDEVNWTNVWKLTGQTENVQGTDDSFTESNTETNEFKIPDRTLRPPFEEDKPIPDVAIITTRRTTPKPWASSTAQIHTFKYPSSTEPNSMINLLIMKKPRPTPHPIGLTTWFDIMGESSEISSPSSKVTQPHKLIFKQTTTPIPQESSTIRTKVQSVKPPTYATRAPTVRTTTPTTTTTTTERTTMTTRRPTTAKTTPSTTEKLPSSYRPRPLRPRPTTEKIIYTRPTTTERVYTLPPRKRFTPTTQTTTQKVPTVYVSKTTKKPITHRPVDPQSAILQEDLESNLDDFVNQVVQGLAGSLDNAVLEDLVPGLDQGSSSKPADIPPTIHPFHVLDHIFSSSQSTSQEKVPLVKPGKNPIKSGTTGSKPNVKEKLDLKDIPSKSSTTLSTSTFKPMDYKKDCGVRPLAKQGRIVGGTSSKFGRWPWQALVRESTWLGLFTKNKCGGVLISPKYVLTAAHCQPGFLATLTVVLGDFDISSETEGAATNHGPITKNIRRVIVHRDYNAQTFENDIALLELDSPVEYQQHIVPVCLPNDNDEFIGKKAYVTGWGRLKYGGGVPQTLHEVDVPIMNNTICQDMFLKSGHIKAIRESFICAGYAQGLKDSCEGDSGGPLQVQRPSGQWVLAGTVSHGIKCAYPNLPGVYMRMTFYKLWIKKVTGLNI